MLSHILGWGLATLSFDRYKIAQTLQGRSCLLCFETVLGMNKITPTTSPPPTNKKVFQKNFFNEMIFLKKLIKGVGLATLSLINYNMARGLLGRSCLKYFNIIKKTTPSPTPTVKKLVKFQKFIFSFVTIFFKIKLISYPAIGKVW